MSGSFLIPQTVLDQIEDPYFCCNLQGEVIACNKSFKKIFNGGNQQQWIEVIQNACHGALNQPLTISAINAEGKSLHWLVEVKQDQSTDQQLYFLRCREAETTDYHGQTPEQMDLMAAGLDGFSFTDREGVFRKVSTGFASLFGYEASELLGRHFTEISGPMSFERQEQIRKALYTEGSIGPLEKDYFHKSGRLIPVMCHIFASKNANGSVEGSWAMIRSIAHVRDLEKTAESSKTKYQYLFDNSLDGISRASIGDSMITDCNDAFCELTGYTRDEIVGAKTIEDLSTRDWVENRLPKIKETIIETGLVEIHEKDLVSKDGQSIPVTMRSFAEYNENGKITAIWTLTRDNRKQRQLIEDLSISETRFRSMFDHSLDSIAFFGDSDCCEFANQAYCDMLGYSLEELRQLEYKNYTNKGWEEVDEQLSQQLKERGYTDVFEKEYIHKDGRIIPVSLRASSVKDPTGKSEGAWLIIRDISRSQSTLNKLQHSQQILEQTGRLARVGGWELDINTQAVTLTKEVFRILGLSNQFEPSMDVLMDMFSEDSRQEIRASIEVALMLSTPFDIETEYLGFKTSRWIRLTGRVRKDQRQRQYIVGAIQDITEYKKIQEQLSENRSQLEHLAFHDSLTGLPNKTLLEDRLRHAIYRMNRRKGDLSFLLIDVDGFKKINDSYGHSIGDQFLIQISKRLIGLKRQEDTLSRLDGDEFVLLAENCGRVDAMTLANKILDEIARPVELGDLVLSSSASIGLVVIPQDTESFELIFEFADKSITAAKQKGLNQIVTAQEVKY